MSAQSAFSQHRSRIGRALTVQDGRWTAEPSTAYGYCAPNYGMRADSGSLDAPLPIEVRAVVSQARRDGIIRRYRRAVMQQARAAEQARRDALRTAQVEPVEPVERVTVPALKYLTQDQCSRLERALGAPWRPRKRARLAADRDASDGRSGVRETRLLLDRPFEYVRAIEARASDRWQGTAEPVLTDGRPVTGPCYSMTVSSRRYRQRGHRAAVAAAEGAGRTWAAFTPAPRERAAQRRRGTVETAADRRAASDARVRAMLGSIHTG